MSATRSAVHVALVGRALAAALCLAPFGAPRAQVRVLDEGSFTIYRGETRVGREDFAIRATADPNGPLAAQGTTAIETKRFLPALSASAAGLPVSYQLEVRDGRVVTDRWTVQIGAGRAVTRRRATGGESSSEFPVPPSSLLLDDDIAHQAWFLIRKGRAAGTSAISVIRPREGLIGQIVVEELGPDTLRIGGVPVPAIRWRLKANWPGGDRDVWADAKGRLLQVVPSTGSMRYVRDEAPSASEPNGNS